MTGERRLSQAISEGDGISLIAPVDGPDAARRAEDSGAEAVLVPSGRQSQLRAIREATSLPVLFYWDGEPAAEVAAADACVVEAGGEDDREWLDLGDQFELAFRIEDEEHLTGALESFDPEIFILAATDEDALDRVLDLLPDVPAGKLAIADLRVTSREEVAELERAGVDAVIVGTPNVAKLVGAAPPEV